MADEFSSNDNGEDNNKGGIGLGSVAAGVGAGAATGLGAAAYFTRDAEKTKTREALTKAEAEHAKLEVEHASAIANAELEVRKKPEGRELYSKKTKAQEAFDKAKRAHEKVEKDAVGTWKNKGSPEAIASKDDKLIKASRDEGEKYEIAAEGVKTKQEVLDKTVEKIKKDFKELGETKTGEELKKAKQTFVAEFLAENKNSIGTTEKPWAISQEHLTEFEKYQEEFKTAALKGEVTKLKELEDGLIARLPGAADLTAEQQKALIARLEGYHEDLSAIKATPETLKELEEAKIEKYTKPLKAEIAEHQAVLDELAPKKVLAVDAVVSKSKAELTTAEAALKTATEAVDGALAKHAGKEVGAIKSAKSLVETLTKRASVLEGEGNFLSKAVKTRAGLMIMAPIAAMGAVIGGTYLLMGGKKDDSRWQNQVNTQRAMSANSNSQGMATGVA